MFAHEMCTNKRAKLEPISKQKARVQSLFRVHFRLKAMHLAHPKRIHYAPSPSPSNHLTGCKFTPEQENIQIVNKLTLTHPLTNYNDSYTLDGLNFCAAKSH